MTTLSHNSVKIIHFPGGPVNPVNGRGRVKQRKQESPALHVVSSANRPFLRTNQRSRASARKSRTAALNRLGRQLKALGNEGRSPFRPAKITKACLRSFSRPHFNNSARGSRSTRPANSCSIS